VTPDEAKRSKHILNLHKDDYPWITYQYLTSVFKRSQHETHDRLGNLGETYIKSHIPDATEEEVDSVLYTENSLENAVKVILDHRAR